MSSTWARTALQHCAFHGLPATVLAELAIELAPKYEQAHADRAQAARGRARQRAAGAGRRPKLVFVDALLLTLAYLRLDITQRALAVLYDVDQAQVSRAITLVRPLLANRGCATPAGGPRLATLADVLAYAHTTGFDLCLDATEIPVRRPAAGKPGRRAFVSGKARRNTIKTAVICDQACRLLWTGAIRPGRMHDATQIRTEGLEDLLHHFTRVRIWADQAYERLARDHPGQIIVKHPPLPATASPEDHTHIAEIRKMHCQQRIPVEQTIAKLKTWRGLNRWHKPRHQLPQTIAAIAALVSDITAQQ